jgi:hypothetical protein
MSGANYNGRQANNTAYIKNFVYGNGVLASLWKIFNYTKINGIIETVITLSSSKIKGIQIAGDIFVDGSLCAVSDVSYKKNIKLLNNNVSDKIMKLKPKIYELKNDTTSQLHYGFIAQEVEDVYPELVYNKPDQKYNNIKSLNYLEIIPLLVNKIQNMQREIDELKRKV